MGKGVLKLNSSNTTGVFLMERKMVQAKLSIKVERSMMECGLAIDLNLVMLNPNC